MNKNRSWLIEPHEEMGQYRLTLLRTRMERYYIGPFESLESIQRFVDAHERRTEPIAISWTMPYEDFNYREAGGYLEHGRKRAEHLALYNIEADTLPKVRCKRCHKVWPYLAVNWDDECIECLGEVDPKCKRCDKPLQAYQHKDGQCLECLLAIDWKEQPE